MVNKKPKKVNYPKKAYPILASIEDRHFWFQGRNSIIKAVILKMLNNKKGLNFLEVGCGTGYVLRMLDGLGLKVTGLDNNKEGLVIARRRVQVPLVCSTLQNARIKKKFDAIGMFDVLEHIENQKEFLNHARVYLKKNGILFLTVPAHMWLWSEIDEISGHERRYSKKDLEKILRDAGFKVQKVSYFNFFLLVPQFLVRNLIISRNNHNNKKGMELLDESLVPPNALINRIFRSILYFESLIINYTTLFTGTSLIVAARKVKD